MIDIQFRSEPSPSEIQEIFDRIQSAGVFPRGVASMRAFEFDEDTETFVVDFEQLKRILLEHQMFQQAEGFNSTELDILRVLEAGRDRMRFDEIREATNLHRKDKNEDPLKNTTIQHYLRNLRKKNLISHEHNQYTYIGP